MSEDTQFTKLGKNEGSKWVLGNDGSLRQNKLIRRYAAHKTRTEEFTAYLKNYFYERGHKVDLSERNLREQIPKLEDCGSYLLFRQYYLKEDTRLVSANFCRKHTLCGLCAVRRAAKGAQNLHEKAEKVLSDHPELNAYFVVLTVKNEPDLAYAMRKLKKGWDRIKWTIRDAKRARKTQNPAQSKYASALNSEFASVVGGAYSIEITFNQEEKTWHPHMNLLLLSEADITNEKLSREWKKYTGDSFITYCDELNLAKDKWAFCEIMKYAMKFSELPFNRHKEAYLTLLGKRMKGSIGAFYGVELEPNPADEAIEGEPYIEILLSYSKGEYSEIRQRRAGIEKKAKKPNWVRSDLIPN